jgi:hypothetical protein
MCRDAPPRHLCRAEGGKDCSDDRALWACWNRACVHSFHRPSCPCSAWFAASAVTPFGHHVLKLISSSLPRHVPRSTRLSTAVINQGQSLLCCASSCPCSSWFIARACQDPCRHNSYPTYTIHEDGTAALHGAPVPWPHHPFVVCVVFFLICLLCIGRSPHLPHCPR